MWTSWVFWMIAAVGLAILEVVLPSFIFLGFAIGAALVGLILLFGGTAVSLSVPMTFLVFAVVSLISWILLRQLLGVHKGQVKVWDKDIND
ncbi:NfeD family protein [Planktotalea arctica]|uniref:NfeD family protein n=1 Tax=Planktotalea arctica TaxID=1481893 RepID=UPI00321B97E0